MRRLIGAIVDLAASGLCVAAGVYLLSQNSLPVDLGGQHGRSWFEVLAHGIGIYFIGKGLFVLRSTWLEAETAAALRRMGGTPERARAEREPAAPAPQPRIHA